MHTPVQIVANLPRLSNPHKKDQLDLGSGFERSAISIRSNNVPDPNPVPMKYGLKHETFDMTDDILCLRLNKTTRPFVTSYRVVGIALSVADKP